MKRKEVVVGDQVFDLGLKDIEKAVANTSGRLPTMELEVGDTIFQVGFLAEERAVALNWWGCTNIRNIVWTRFTFLRLGWPLVKTVSAFTYAKEGV
jgi:hypothetical protein